MAQVVEYEQILGTRFDQYIFKLRLILGYLNQPGGTKFKGFRDFLRKQNLWDKEKSAAMLSMVEISWDKTTVRLGKTARKLMNLQTEADFQNALLERLKDLNLLLVKFVLEALDVTQGGRLHSVHELYRMITSYVYPGAYVTLTSFQAWIEWLAACGCIKLVGIRWALSDRGQKEVNELRQLDIDEVLEEMEEDEEEEDDDEFVPSGGADLPVAAAAPAPQARDDIDDDEDLFADLPPEPEIPSDDVVRAASARYGLEEEVIAVDPPAPRPPTPKYTPPASLTARAKPAKPAAQPAPVAVPVAGLHLPLAAPAHTVVPVSALSSMDNEAIVERVMGFWQALGDWPSYTAESLGVEYDQGAGDLKVLIELGVLAVLVEGLDPQPQVFAFVKRIRETTFFASLGHGEGLEEGLDALERASREPWARPLFERLVHARFIARRVGNKIDLLYQLRQAQSGRDVVALLREHMTGPDWVEAPFWVARELVRLGLLEEEHHRSAVAVPTRRLVENAARIGLVSATPLRDGESVMALSESVSKLFGSAEAGYGEALACLDRGLGLSV